ncbi:hypothetical protein ITJ38_04620 [Agreia pratensis]|uniref:SCO7613 C-terminal domain-containing membrane protein n=1 Tax=Agreia pratensis TaxID=150121 RepID=UPI00188BF0A0|nr:hypothetical protein [Agreia pratensis]MBF4633685.1 hypothetical protein [Agreia pratensis]
MTDPVPAAVPSSGAAWPTTPQAFADTTLCPRCFAVLLSSRCHSCGLELAVPLAAELIAASHTLVDAERHRRDLIQRMWNEQLAAQLIATPARPAPTYVPDAASAAAATAIAPPLPAFPSVSPHPSTVSPPGATPAPTVPPSHESSDSRPRRSGVQVFLLVTGIVLLSVFALFFVTVAYLFATVEVRVVVTALAGLVVFGVAWVLKRRHLPATAEGVGVTGAVILLGVLEFVRGAELFGSASITPALFSGAGFLALSALLEALHRISRLRFARLGSVLLAPTGVALVVVGALGSVDSGLAWWAGLVAAGASTLALPQIRERSGEAALVRWVAVVSMTAALIPAALLLPEVPGSSALSYSVSAIVWGAFILRLRAGSGAHAWSRAASVMLGLSVSLAPTVAIFRHASTEWNLWAPGTAAAIVAVTLVIRARTSTTQLASRICRDAQIPALIVAALGLLPGVGLAAIHILGSVFPRYLLWQARPGDAAGFVPETGAWAAVLAPAVAALLGAVAIRLARLPSALGALVGCLSCVALLAAASHAGTVLLSLLAYAIVATTGLAALLATRGRRVPAVRVPAAIALGVATFAVVILSHASTSLWLPGTLATAALIVVSRFAIAPSTPAASFVRPLLTGFVAGFLFVEMTLLMPWISGWRPSLLSASSPFPAPTDFFALPGAGAVLLLCVVPLALRSRIDRASRGTWDLRAAAVVALLTAAISSLVLFVAGSASAIDHGARIAIPLGLAVAAIVWQIRGSVAHTAERVALAGLAPLALTATLASVADAATASSTALMLDLAAPVAAILSAALGAVLFTRASPGIRSAARIAWECAIALVMIVSIVRCIASADASTWLILLLLAVTPIIVSFADGNPFRSRSPRRFGGALSCVLATAALWQFLAFRGTVDVEPYTLPLAGMLLCLTAAIAVFSTQTASVATVRSTLFAAALVIALVPSALVSIADERPTRGVVVLVIAAVLTAAALLAPRVIRGVIVRDSALYSSIAVLVTIGLARAVRDAIVSEDGVLFPEIWVLPAVIALVVTSAVWTRRRALPFRVAQLGVPAAVALIGLISVVCLITLPETNSSTRLAVVSTTFVGVVVAAAVRRWVPLDRVSQITALCVLVVVGATGLVTGAAHPFELSTTPVGLALIVSGLVTLRRDASARTWPNLGPGIAVLLVPSLLADFGSTELWRVIALGVLSVALVAVSITLRWQAPLIVSGTVLLVHALAQSWPWIQGLYSVVPWWIWLGIGGALLIALAARYEHRVRNLRSFVGTISSLR